MKLPMIRAAIILIYAITPLVAGHGIVPIGAVPFIDQPPWSLIALGCGAAMVIGLSNRRWRSGSTTPLFIQLAGTFVLYSSWIGHVVVFAQRSSPSERGAALESMLLLSLPFQLISVAIVFKLITQIRESLI
ncbi:hypothetical protein LZK98_17120 [Sphingomonas cannabina]|uniref:hypothetical protein n=1 Tax=Sphingomonas cannabina TaxID=2899123 RepID=UPI001F1869AB|nr:hypothetical protein [Sphingomonas cannabina]UIJ44757.1 hypothetical protein LZK98_17120 [Sphingomonas cannabina]